MLTLLRQIDTSGRLDGQGREQLAAAMNDIEQHYFARGDGPDPDLHAIAQEWLRRVG